MDKSGKDRNIDQQPKNIKQKKEVQSAVTDQISTDRENIPRPTEIKSIYEKKKEDDLVDVGGGSLMSQSEILDFAAGADSD